MLNWFHKIVQTRYVGLLEGEVTRLRAENRALMNSLLGTAGFPPVEFPEAPKPQPLPRLRKRSWHQLQAWRETEASSLRPGPVGTNRDTTASLGERMSERANGPAPHS